MKKARNSRINTETQSKIEQDNAYEGYFLETTIAGQVVKPQHVEGLSEINISNYSDSATYSTIKMPGTGEYGNVTLLGTEFRFNQELEEWFNQLTTNTTTKSNLDIRLVTNSGLTLITWTLSNAWTTRAAGIDVNNEIELIAEISIVYDNLTISASHEHPTTIDGDEQNDVINGHADDDAITGAAGHDTIQGGLGNDTIQGGPGNDTINGGEPTTDSTSIRTFSSLKTSTSKTDHDILRGNSGDDVIIGGRGNDKLYGNQGNDLLFSGIGKDLLVGGKGRDCYVYTAAADSKPSNRDTIRFRKNDSINLCDLKIDSGSRRIPKLTWIGDSYYSGTRGEIRFSRGLLDGDLDGDMHTDFSIRILSKSLLTESQLIL